MAEQWAAFFQRVKSRPPAFYEKCALRLESQDIYEPSDLADVDEELFVKLLTAPPGTVPLERWPLTGGDGSQAATAGEVTFLRQALELARSDAGQHHPKTLLEANGQEGEEGGGALAAELRGKAEKAETRLKAVEAVLEARSPDRRRRSSTMTTTTTERTRTTRTHHRGGTRTDQTTRRHR